MWNYERCQREYATRRRGMGYKRINRQIKLQFDGTVFYWKHWDTVTVEIHPDKFVINRHGWNTKTTHDLIQLATGVYITARGPNLSESGWYVWASHYLKKAHFFEDGDEFGMHGQPLQRRPWRVRKIKQDASRQWRQMRKQLVAKIATRIMIGEFDERGDEYFGKKFVRVPDADECLQAVDAILECTDIIPHELVEPLLIPRPRTAWGRGGEYVRNHDEPYSGMRLLQTSLAAARRAFYKDVKAYYYAYPENDNEQ